MWTALRLEDACPVERVFIIPHDHPAPPGALAHKKKHVIAFLGVVITVSCCFCRTARHSVVAGLLICAGLGALALPIRAQAQLAGGASATTQFESNSNLYALDYGLTQPITKGSGGSTTDFSYGAQFGGTYTLSRQQLYATASAHKYDYQQFSELNHYEYSFDTGLKWQLAEILDGNLEVGRTRSMVPFLDLTGSSVLALSLLTEQRETFQMGLKLGSDWKVEGSTYTSRSTQPSPGAPDQRLTQTTGTMSLEYSGLGPFTSGLTATYLSGDYGGLSGAPDSSYSQSTAGFLANYKLKRTSFEGQVTYSHRTSDTGRDSASGLTGSISFKDQLTPKTSFSVEIDRNINTYYLNLGSEVDTEAAANVNWQATYKTGVSLGYTFTYRAFPGQATGPQGSYPVDYQQYVTLGISYQPTRWLSIGPYANVQTRRSNVFGRDFNATVYGVSITASTPTPEQGERK